MGTAETMTKQQIKKYLKMRNEQLAEMGIKGEICLYGGAIMCMVFDARPATKDIDAVFKPEQKIHLAALRIAKEHHLKIIGRFLFSILLMMSAIAKIYLDFFLSRLN